MSRTAMKLALEALEWCHGGEPCGTAESITALREALAEQPAPPPECKTEAEKIAYVFGWFKALESVRGQPAQHTWVGLTEGDKQYLNEVLNLQGRFPIIDAIEAKLKEKNTP